MWPPRAALTLSRGPAIRNFTLTTLITRPYACKEVDTSLIQPALRDYLLSAATIHSVFYPYVVPLVCLIVVTLLWFQSRGSSACAGQGASHGNMSRPRITDLLGHLLVTAACVAIIKPVAAAEPGAASEPIARADPGTHLF